MTIEQKIKDYWNAQPCNINHSKEPFGTVEYFDSVTTKRYKAEPHILDFAGFHLWRGKRVLEVGCGIGTDAEQFMRHGAEYTGIDISDESLRICEQRADVQGLKGKFINRSATENLENLGKFDLVYSYGVLHHYPNIEQSIQNIHDVINLNGEFRFMVYAKDSWKYSMIRKGLDQFEAQADCPYAEAFTRNEIELLLKDDFWKIERLRQAHCFMYNVEKYKKGIFEFEPWFESMSEVMREAVKEYLGWHLLVKTRRI